MIAAWNRFWFTPEPASTLGTCRALFFGGLAVWLIPHDFSAWGGYSPVFWMPVWLFEHLKVPQLATPAIAFIQAIWKLSLVLAAVGLFTQPAMVIAFLLGTYLMGLPQNFGQTEHFDTLVVFATGALAISRAGDACSIDALLSAARRRSAEPRRDSSEYRWPIRFVWVAMAIIFCSAGISKLRHSGLEWIFSDNLAYLLQRQQYHLSDGEPLTSWGPIVAAHPTAARGMAASSVAIETLFPLVLFSRRARYVLVPAGLSFLIGIRLLMGPTFEQFMLCNVFWIPWHRVAAAVRSRFPEPSHLVIYDAGCGLCSRSVVVLSRLDILQRLRFIDIDAGWSWLAREYPMLDREACLADMHVITGVGRALTGFDGYRSMAAVLPVLWPLLPFLYLPGIPQAGRRVYRFVASHRATTTCALPARHA